MEQDNPETRTIAALQEEIARLRRRVAELEASLPPVSEEPRADGINYPPNAFKTIVERCPVGVGISSLDGFLVYANQEFRSLLGIGESLERVSLTSIHPPEVAPIVEQAKAEAINTGGWHGLLTYQRLDGSTFPGVVAVYAIHDQEGKPWGLAGIIRDLSQQRRQEQALRASEERFRTIIEKIPAGVCITNREQKFEYVNPAYCRIYRYQPEELIGKPFTIVVPEHNREAMSRLHDEFFAGNKEIRGEWDVIASDGTPLRIMADAALITGEDGLPRKVTFVMDITEQQRSEEERVILQQQVIEAQRAAIRELSTPLIPLSDSVVLMPLVGSIDSQRAQMIMETLLEGVAKHEADVAILDITGVSMVDTQVANAIIQAAQAVRLLGARVILTGIGPIMAQTLVHLGADLSSITTRGSLQSAVAEALAAQR